MGSQRWTSRASVGPLSGMSQRNTDLREHRWLLRVFCKESETDFVDGTAHGYGNILSDERGAGVEELIHAATMDYSVLMKVHLAGDGRGEATQLVAANPTATIAHFKVCGNHNDA